MTMPTEIKREDLWSLEQYATQRAEFRAQVMQHKKTRQVALGEHATLYFEDFLTIKYQIQEMLRIEKVFEAEGIHDELAAYNPLIPNGNNWKATFMLEYPDPIQRAEVLKTLIGIEDRVYVVIDGCDKCFAIADEDMDRSNAEKTSSVHFVRFELNDEMRHALKQGNALSMGIDHENYRVEALVDKTVKASLLNDFA